jgi:uncharacterized damage-inducible protein DinB
MNGAMLVPEFDQEMANTRTLLERLPDGRLDYRPHKKSLTMLELASHVANLPTWTGMTLTTEELDLDQGWSRELPTTVAELLGAFDTAVAEARAALVSATAQDLEVSWTLRTGDRTHFSLPRAAVLRTFVLSHIIHHRAQLGVYLRLVDVPVPGMYGPSADEAM